VVRYSCSRKAAYIFESSEFLDGFENAASLTADITIGCVFVLKTY